MACIGLGVVFLLDSELLFGGALIGGSVAFIGLGVATFGSYVAAVLDYKPSKLLGGMAFISFGVAVIVGGVGFLLDSELLFGVAAIGSGVAELRSHSGVASRLRALISKPPKPSTPDR